MQTVLPGVSMPQEVEKMQNNPDSAMWNVVGGEINKVNGKTVFDEGDAVAENVIAVYLCYLAEGIVNIVNMFQPEIICLGGGVSGAGDRILKPLTEAVKAKAFARFGKRHTQIKFASLGNDAGIIGAALLWKMRYKVKW